jgi:hypothetical protein
LPRLAELNTRLTPSGQAASKAQRECDAEIEELEESTHRLLAELNDGELDRLQAQYVVHRCI